MFIKGRCFAILAIGALLAGCPYFSKEGQNSGPCVVISVTHKPDPVIADLGYEDIKGRQEAAVYPGGFQHALVIPLVRRIPGAGEDGLLKTDEEAVYFLFDHADMQAGEKGRVESFIEKIGIPNIKNIVVRGHTDSVGGEGYNMSLSERRANEVKKHLVRIGVRQELISTVGFGEHMPVDANNTERGRGMNRRAEISTATEDQ
jgi:outer membrane protein OmpA-like peptidoglycan-associated protein